MMPDIPKLPAVKLHDEMTKVVKAAAAVREGIATHAQKHAAARSEHHKMLEANRKLRQDK